MKKKGLITGIILLAVSALAWLLSQWAYHMGGMVMDGPDEYYHRWYLIYSFFINAGKYFLIAGIIVTAVFLILSLRKKP